jgi:hypothetical protein
VQMHLQRDATPPAATAPPGCVAKLMTCEAKLSHILAAAAVSGAGRRHTSTFAALKGNVLAAAAPPMGQCGWCSYNLRSTAWPAHTEQQVVTSCNSRGGRRPANFFIALVTGSGPAGGGNALGGVLP